MIPVISRRGRRYFILSERELDRPIQSGQYVRAYCPIHGGDHTRSLALHPSGWGFCFNAGCPAFSASFAATVLIQEWNRDAAEHLLRWSKPGSTPVLSSLPEEKNRQLDEADRLPLLSRPQLRSAGKRPQWQQDELLALYRAYDSGFLLAGLDHPIAKAYLEGRRTPRKVAEMTGMGYLPPLEEVPRDICGDGEHRLSPRWCNRIIFPTGAWWPDTTTRIGFCGRSLTAWRQGMTEREHKAVLEQQEVKRWLKTWPHGWFGFEPAGIGGWVVLVEGPFDRCALLAAGFASEEVIALVGTGASIAWFPASMTTVVLALDADEGGKAAAAHLAIPLRQSGRLVIPCAPPQDQLGKDWSERWESSGLRGLLPLLKLRNQLRSA